MTEGKSTKKKQKIFGLNTLRFLAFTSVFLAHATPYGHVANIRVSFFFVLSGFLLTYLALVEINRTNQFSKFNFFIRRGLRIYPLYFLIISFSFFILPIVAQKFNYSVTLPEKPWMYFVFLSNFEYSEHIYALQFYWAIAVEEQFYILFLLFSNFFKKYIYVLCIILYILFIIGVVAGMHYNWHLYPNPVFHLASFSTGILMGKLFFENKIPQMQVLLFAFFFSLGLMFIFFNTPVIRPFRGIPTSFFFATLIFIVILLFNNSSIRQNWIFRTTEKLGIYTYGLYMFSGFIMIFSSFFIKINQPYIFLLFEFCLLLLVAYISYHFYEKRFLKLKRFFFHSTKEDL